MTWYTLDSWIVLTGALCGMSCALPGNFLLLRRMSMMGDAISHAVLPGLAIGFLLTGSRTNVPMLAGAVVAGVLAAVFTQWLQQRGQVDEHAAMGVSFTALFALGLMLMVQAADQVDLDPSCVLYGAIELSPLDTWTLGRITMPRAVWLHAGGLLANGLLILALYKELKLSAFDSALADSLGFSSVRLHYILMIMVALTTVLAFETVGSILVVAMLIVPAATAYQWTDRLGWMIALSLVFAALYAVAGHVAAITVPVWFGQNDTSTAGSMATVAGLGFLLSVLVAPRYGVISRKAARWRLSVRILVEDVLGMLYRGEEICAPGQVLTSRNTMRKALGADRLRFAVSIWKLQSKRLIHVEGSGFRLTSLGVERARSVVRDHRLWESYLHQVLHLRTDHLHRTSESLEHITDEPLRTALLDEAHNPKTDPQGRTIP